MKTIYVNKKELNDIFKLDGLIKNVILSIENYNDSFYEINYNKKIYERLLKISKLSYTQDIKKLIYNDTIDFYVKIIKYCEKHKCNYEDIMIEEGVKEITKEIDMIILRNLFKNYSKNNNEC